MINDDLSFQPKLGRIRDHGGKRTKGYYDQVMAIMQRGGGLGALRRSRSSFSGTRIGRGVAFGSACAIKSHAFQKFRGRRAVVKVRIVTLKNGGIGAARTHMKYIQRDGMGRDGSRENLYSRDVDNADGRAFVERSEGDRHQFRMILSPEDGDELNSLTDYTRDFMKQVERDLGTELDWVAVNHYNTDNPHVHIVVRGKDDLGKDLVIARDYLSYGMRRRACEIATDELGPRKDLDIAKMQKRQVEQERVTNLDRDLMDMAEDGIVNVNTSRTAYDRFQRSLLIGRLTVLKEMGLAEEQAVGKWRLDSDLEPVLRKLQRRHDIIRTMQAALEPERSGANFEIFDPGNPGQDPVLGRVAATGPSNELDNGRYLIVDADDGKQWHVDVGDVGPGGVPSVGSIVEIKRSSDKPRSVDLTIDAIARETGGLYSDEAHAKYDPSARISFRESHKRRLEALRRQKLVERLPDGSWTIPENYVARAQAMDARRQGRLRLQTLSWLSIDKLIDREAATWLDRAIEQGYGSDLSMRGFGAELSEALKSRQAWLKERGYAHEQNGEVTIRRETLRKLQETELANTGRQLADKLGLDYVPAHNGDRVEGKYRMSIGLASGRYALLERSKEFTLVPWRDVLERHRNRTISGLMRGHDINWDFGRKRRLSR